MPAADELVVKIKGDTRNLRRDMRQTERTVKSSGRRMGRSMTGFNSRLKAIGATMTSLKGLAIIGVATGFAYMAKRAIDSADAIAKTADKIGLTTDMLQELRHVADLAGVSQQSLDSSMERFVKRIGEAVRGTGEAKKVYEEWGISILDASGKIRDQEAILNDVADAMKKTETQTERVAAAAALFGRDGVAMVNMLAKGSEELKKARQAARDYGIVIDEELLRKSEKAKDALTIAGKQIKTAWTEMILESTGAITKLAQGLTAVIRGTKDLLTITKTEAINKEIDFAEKRLKSWGKLLDELEGKRFTGRSIIAAKEAIALLEAKLTRLRHEKLKIQIEFDKPKQPAGAPEEILPGVKEDLKEIEYTGGLAYQNLIVMADVWGTVHTKVIDKIIKENKEWAAGTQLIRQYYLDLLGPLSVLHDVNKEGIDAYLKSLDAVEEKTVKATATTATYNTAVLDTLNDIKFATEGWGRDFEETIISATRTGKLSFKDMADSIIADIERMIIRTTITKPLMGFLQNLLTPRLPWNAANVAGGFFPLQHGGPVRPGKPHIVGEAGPEIFVPRSAGQVIPNKRTGAHPPMSAGPAGITYQQVFQVSPGVPQTVRAEMLSLAPYFRKLATAAVAQAISQGGPFAKKMGVRS